MENWWQCCAPQKPVEGSGSPWVPARMCCDARPNGAEAALKQQHKNTKVRLRPMTSRSVVIVGAEPEPEPELRTRPPPKPPPPAPWRDHASGGQSSKGERAADGAEAPSSPGRQPLVLPKPPPKGSDGLFQETLADGLQWQNKVSDKGRDSKHSRDQRVSLKYTGARR